MLSHFSHVWLCSISRTVAWRVPLSRGFSRQEYWSGLLFPSPGDLPDPGIKTSSLTSLALKGRVFTIRAAWETPDDAPTVCQILGQESPTHSEPSSQHKDELLSLTSFCPRGHWGPESLSFVLSNSATKQLNWDLKPHPSNQPLSPYGLNYQTRWLPFV